MVTDEYFTGSENAPEDQEAAELLEPYLIDEIWPSFTYDAEENDEISILEADLEKYITEMQAAFITGETDFSEWDDYIETVEKMRSEERRVGYECHKRRMGYC